MFDIGGPEILFIFIIFLLLFGANRLPELAKGVGKSVREFKKAASGVENEVRRAMEEEPSPPPKKFPPFPPGAGPVPQISTAPDKPVPPAAPPESAD